MNDLLEKMSSYNVFNYLFPGALFAGIGSSYTSYSLVQDNLIIALFTYYFFGLVISRMGSLCLEPPLKKWGFLKFADYGDYVTACKSDKTLQQLSEANNMYRTLSSLVLSLIGLVIVDNLSSAFPRFASAFPYGLVSGLLVLFVFSHRKQTEYIAKRIAAGNQRE